MNPTQRGVLYGAGAYFLWGAFPLYFRLMEESGAFEIVLHRILWGLVVCVAVVSLTRAWRRVAPVLRTPRQVLPLAAAAAFLAVNWGVYVYAVNSQHVVEASLGYFINPLVTVVLGVVVLRERLRRAQWVAVGIGAVAVAVLTVDYGRLPWISLVLAGSFGVYGLLKKQVGADVGALESLTTETLVLAPFAVVALAVLEAGGDGTFTADPPWQALLLASTGVITVVPLLLFAAGARRVPLSTMGLLQYLTPALQLAAGVLLLGETMPASRWFGFGLVWLALVVLTADTLRAARVRSRLAREADPLPA